MNFWENVINELEYQCKTRKWLAAKAQFDVSTIGTGLRRESIPQADLALRIADALNVPLAYLLPGTEPPEKTPAGTHALTAELDTFRTYRSVIRALNTLPSAVRQTVIKMIEDMGAVFAAPAPETAPEPGNTPGTPDNP